MNKQRSFTPGDFSLRDIPCFLVVYLAISAICIGLGVAVERLPSFWRGVLCGMALGLLSALVLLRPRKEIDVATLPEPSSKVRAKCDDPDCSLAEAVRVYREETGLGLAEATAVLKAYLAEPRSDD